MGRQGGIGLMSTARRKVGTESRGSRRAGEQQREEDFYKDNIALTTTAGEGVSRSTQCYSRYYTTRPRHTLEEGKPRKSSIHMSNQGSSTVAHSGRGRLAGSLWLGRESVCLQLLLLAMQWRQYIPYLYTKDEPPRQASSYASKLLLGLDKARPAALCRYLRLAEDMSIVC